MEDYKVLTAELCRILKLDVSPVAVKLCKEASNNLLYETSGKFTICQFLMLASEGEKKKATADNISCPNGASALGFRAVPDRLLNGEFLAQLGTYEKEAGKKTMQETPRFEQGMMQEVLFSPLAETDFEPDIIVVEAKPEQLMWLALAVNYNRGGRLNFSTSVSNGTCVDMIVVPYLTNDLNVSLGCYGCRNATNIPDESLMAGFPGSMLESIVASLGKLGEKAMPRTREKQAYKLFFKASRK